MLSEADKEILKEYFGKDNLKLGFFRYQRTNDPNAKDFAGIEIFKKNFEDNIDSLHIV